jgi:hypothetical protein
MHIERFNLGTAILILAAPDVLATDCPVATLSAATNLFALQAATGQASRPRVVDTFR